MRTASALGAAGLCVRLSAAGVRDGADDAARLAAALGALKGPLAKMGQWLAHILDVLPPAYAEALGTLQQQAPPMGPPSCVAAWPPSSAQHGGCASRPSTRPSVSATSLGQVHRARFADGREVACKLQYPRMRAVIRSDITQLRFIASAWRRIDGAVDPDETLADVAERLEAETDCLT